MDNFKSQFDKTLCCIVFPKNSKSMQIDLKLLSNRTNNKFGNDHTYLNSQAATHILASSLLRDDQGFFIFRNEGATMKQMSSKFIHRKDSGLLR